MIDTAEELQEAVQQLHQCTAQFVNSTQVIETFQGKFVWEGIVFIFDLINHPQAKRAYAWSSPIEGSTRRKYNAVLHIPPVNSPKKAVRALIVQDSKMGGR